MGFELITYILSNALTDCATLYDDLKKPINLYLILQFISIESTSKYEGVPYHPNLIWFKLIRHVWERSLHYLKMLLYTSCSFSDRSIFVSDFWKIPIHFHRFLIITPSKSPSLCIMSKLVKINQWSWRRSQKCRKVCRLTPNKRKCDQKSSLWLSPTHSGRLYV